MLTGDRHLNGAIDSKTRLLPLTTNSGLSWTRELHFKAGQGSAPGGNVGLADGSVIQSRTKQLQTQVEQMFAATNRPIYRLAVP
jgi:hypothetical protein